MWVVNHSVGIDAQVRSQRTTRDLLLGLEPGDASLKSEEVSTEGSATSYNLA